MENNKEKYRRFAENENIPLFSQAYWLDSVAGDHWQVAMATKNNEILATMPYVLKKHKGLTFIEQAPLVQKLGVYIKYPKGQKYYNKLSYEKQIFDDLFAQLPDFDVFKMNFDNNITNFLPLHWLGYKIRVRYSYIIKTSVLNLDEIQQRFSSKARNKLKKKDLYTITETNSVREAYELNLKRYEKSGKKIPFTQETLEKIFLTLKEKNNIKIISAKQDQEIKATGIFVWDKQTVYYIIGGVSSGNQAGMNLIIWEGIKLAHSLGLDFDFEGSMNPQIEQFFRGFGAEQKFIFYVYKLNSAKAKIINCFKEII